ncbi:MAG: hypothetical protein EP330_24335 [Deltaproteobacteria bacterium]|nr:MAG: hypothetical protein EP330_24335 [Deltaproteobacteria bacterium]
MNPHLCRVALRPRDPFEVFDLTFRYLRERLGPLSRLGLLVLVPWMLVFTGLSWWFEGAFWLAPLALIPGPLLQAPFTLGGGRLLFGDDFAVPEITWQSLRRSTALWLGWALQGFGWALVIAIALASNDIVGWAMFAGAMLGASFLGLFGVFASEAVLLERVGLGRAIRRSGRLSAASGGGALAATMGRWFLVVWMGLVGESVGQALVGFVLQLGSPFGTLWDGYVTPYFLGGMLLAQPLSALYRLLLYVDSRTRSEGWDLQVSLRALGLT